MSIKTAARRILASASSALLFASLLLVPLSAAHADNLRDIINTETEIGQLMDKIDAAQDTYNAAQDAFDEAQAKIDENQVRIDEIEAKLKPLRGQLSEILKWQYQNTSDSLIEILANSNSLEQAINSYEYLMSIAQAKTDTMKAISVGEQELLDENAKLHAEQEAQEAIKAEQQEIMDAAQPDITKLTEQLDALTVEQKEMLGYKGKNGGGAAFDIPSDLADQATVVDYAKSRIGCPYVWGAAGSRSFDCSGLMQWCYRQKGISIPHNSEAQLAAGSRVSLSNLRPGDILWKSGHVGMVAEVNDDDGDGYGSLKSYIHAPHTGANVQLVTAGVNDYNSGKWRCGIRF